MVVGWVGWLLGKCSFCVFPLKPPPITFAQQTFLSWERLKCKNTFFTCSKFLCFTYTRLSSFFLHQLNLRPKNSTLLMAFESFPPLWTLWKLLTSFQLLSSNGLIRRLLYTGRPSNWLWKPAVGQFNCYTSKFIAKLSTYFLLIRCTSCLPPPSPWHKISRPNMSDISWRNISWWNIS